MKYLVAFFLMTSPLRAVVPETFEQPINDFSGGLNTRDPSFRVAPGFSPYMRNVFVDNGSLNGITGYTLLGSTNTLNKVTGIFPYVKDNGETSFIVTDSSVSLETSDFVTFTFVSSGSNTGALLLWIQVREKMWGFNGIDFVRTWDGTTAKRLGLEANTPAVPKFKYGAYYQERVFGFNNPSGASDLDWSDVASSAGVRLNPDDATAWPTTNNLKIGQGDGQSGTALWIQDGQLREGKDRSIYTLYGSNSSDYQVRKEENLGDGVASHESVVQQDGNTYWLGQYGIYENGVRISDLIDTDVEGINRDSINNIQNVWDSRADFNKGLSSGTIGTTVTVSGLVTFSTFQFSATPNIVGTPPGQATLTSANTFYGPIQINFGQNISSGQYVYTSSITVPFEDLVGSPKIGVLIHNPYTGITHFGVSVPLTQSPFTINFTSQSPLFFGSDISASSYTITFMFVTGDAPTQVRITSPLNISFIPSTTGQYISDVATNTSITAWGMFGSNNSPTGGSINFYERTSTSLVNITTQAWVPITPGVIIGDPTQNRFIQWAATLTMTAPHLVNSFFIDDVTIDHIEGVGSTTRAFGISWKNRYWLVTSTAVDTNLKYILVKSKITNKNPNAWMPLEGIDILSMAKNGDSFYGGSSTAPLFYRLDFGTSFNGRSINPVYDTPDLVLGSDFNTKNILKYRIDGQRNSGMNLTVGSSINYGSFSDKTISFDGSGRQRYILKGITNPAKTLRVRLSNSQLDKTLTIYGLTINYKSTDIEEEPQ